jgi:hypothetical protein
LDQFLQGVVSNPLLRDTPELINFFTHGEAEDMPGVAGGSPPTSPGVFGGYSPSAMLSKLANKMVDNPVFASAELKWTEMMKQPRPVFTSTVEADYWQVKQYMKAWDLTPKKLPFEKFVVLVLGTTSAGKSAFINHFLGYAIFGLCNPTHSLLRRETTFFPDNYISNFELYLITRIGYL